MKTNTFQIKGNIVDIVQRRIYKAEISVVEGLIKNIVETEQCPDIYILPGLVDAHVHIESSMLTPQQFARIAVRHGTVATVSDPHEIANVLGVDGISFMLDDAKQVPFKFYFGVPSCVPATSFETSGFVLDEGTVANLIERSEFKYLSEMMNFPGVIFRDNVVEKKLNAAKKYLKPIDGHAPGLSGDDLLKYAQAGISTDHESSTFEEAVEKIKLGVKLQIREGSAAKNFDALIPVIKHFPDDVMLCTDDCHPDDLVEKHILDQIKRGLEKGYDLFDLLRAACYNPKMHYKLENGLLQVGDYADFFITSDMLNFKCIETYINGERVFDGNKTLFNTKKHVPVNNFKCVPITKNDIAIKADGLYAKVIVAAEGDLYTRCEKHIPKKENGFVVSDNETDILKIVVYSRYHKSSPVVGLIRNFGLKRGAIAGSVAHDSHNIIAVGVDDVDIVSSINKVIEMEGGIVAISGREKYTLPLPVAGLMSDQPGEIVAEKYKTLNQKPKEWGCTLNAPFMTLSFMALLVIPELKIGDKGLFDGKEFKLTRLFD